MAVAHATVAANWVASIEQDEEFSASKLKGTNMLAAGDRILSYHWWEMARIVRTRASEPSFWLINGDRYSPSTSKHQSDVRSAISRSNLPKIIVPYTALDAAGINRESIAPLDVREDRWEPVERTVAEIPPSRRTDLTDESADVTEIYDARWDRTEATRIGDRWHYTDRQHWLGDSLFIATVREVRDRPAKDHEREGFLARERWQEAMRDAGWPNNGTAEYDAVVAVHGDAPEHHNVIRVGQDGYKVHEQRDRRAKFLSSFDYQEARPLYFLAELPRSNVETVDDAFELLKPPAVAAAVTAGVEVTRQGDIFAIPTSLTTRELKSIAKDVGKRLALLGGTHQATEVIVTTNGDCYARGVLYHAPGEWRTSDHARRKIGNGKVWHRILKNTVPSFNRNGWTPVGTNSGAIRRGNVRAWSAGGSVD